MQRLPNGNTFVACRNALVEFDRTGKEVFNQQRTNEMAPRRRRSCRDGQIALVNNQGGYARLDAPGKEVKSLHVPFNINFGVNGGQVLPNDHVLVTSWNAGKVTSTTPTARR